MTIPSILPPQDEHARRRAQVIDLHKKAKLPILMVSLIDEQQRMIGRLSGELDRAADDLAQLSAQQEEAVKILKDSVEGLSAGNAVPESTADLVKRVLATLTDP